MQTAAHSTYFGSGRIVISRGSPRGALAGYKMFKALAPLREWMHSPREVYVPLFNRHVLGVLDPQQTWDKLHELAAGAEPVLQCFERPPFTATNWCHRRLVADWFADKLGHTVLEREPEKRPERQAMLV